MYNVIEMKRITFPGDYYDLVQSWWCLLIYFFQDYMGETPMHKAARTGSMECVGLLVSQGAKLR